jgi:DNA-binding CsgD family transcriptional regulator/N-acetylneuraminic acid mutarotase
MSISDQPTVQLSKRELQVLEMIATGASNQEIARKLVISINTVKVHTRNIFEKLNVQSRTEATLKAIQEGWVTVPESGLELSREPESAPALSRSYLLGEATLPAVLPPWQQWYLLVAVFVAIMVMVLPLLSEEARREGLKVPVIYRKPSVPTPEGSSSRWASHSAMPTSRAGLALVPFEQQIFAIGGVRGNDRATRAVEIYDPLTNSWTEGASKPTATSNIAGVVLGDKIYVPGGCTNEEGEASDTLEIYEPKADSWEEEAALPEARCGYGLVEFEEKLYLFGGWNGTAFEDTIFIYSPQTKRWEVSDHTLPRPVGYLGAAVLEGTIYIAGGYDGEEESNQTYAFEFESGKWLEKAPLQEKRVGLGLVSNGQNLFAVGGGWGQALNSSEKYDPKTDTWSSFETPFNNQWRNMGLATVDTMMYAVGGWDGTEAEYMDSVVSYQYLFQLFIPITISQ